MTVHELIDHLSAVARSEHDEVKVRDEDGFLVELHYEQVELGSDDYGLRVVILDMEDF